MGDQVGQRQGPRPPAAAAAGLGRGRGAGARARRREALARHRLRQPHASSAKASAPVVKVNEPVLAAVLATLKVARRQDRRRAAEPRRHPLAQGRDRGDRRKTKARTSARAAEAAIARRLRRRRSPISSPCAAQRGRGARPLLVGAARRDRRAGRARGSRARPQARGDQGAARRADRRRCSAPSERFDTDRLHQEAILLATKADIREELDRLVAHVAEAQAAHRRRRRGRPAARFPGAGAQPRIEYAVRQGQRRRADQYRARTQERGRAVPRAGAEPGMTDEREISRRGIMLVLSSPSGAGKTTLSRKLLEQRTSTIPASSNCRSR